MGLLRSSILHFGLAWSSIQSGGILLQHRHEIFDDRGRDSSVGVDMQKHPFLPWGHEHANGDDHVALLLNLHYPRTPLLQQTSTATANLLHENDHGQGRLHGTTLATNCPTPHQQL